MTIRAPHFSERIERKVQQPHAVANLLVTTLVAVLVPHFTSELTQPRHLGWLEIFQSSRSIVEVFDPGAQHDWPNPQPRLVQQPEQVGKSIVLVEAAVQDPFYQTEWPSLESLEIQQPNPQQRYISFLDPPATQTDWPNPRLLTSVQTPLQVGMPQAIIGDAGDKPVKQDDWITPPGLPTQTPVQLGMPLSILEDAGEKPFVLSEWPNPEPLPTQQAFQIGQSIALVEPEAGDPFFQTDWLNPRSEWWLDVLIQSQGIKELPDAAPFYQTDWITPPATPTVQLEQISKSIALVEPDPFYQTDWLNPRSAWWLEVLTQSRGITELPAGTPFYQTDWPNPQLAVIAQYPEQSSIPTSVFVPLTQKPASSGWMQPEPLGTQQPLQVGISLSILVDAGDKPFLLSEWPQPQPLTTSISEQVSKSIALVETVIAAPFAQTDWPNPLIEITQQPDQFVKPVMLGKPFAQLDWITPPAIPTAQPEQVSESIALVSGPFFIAAWARNTNNLLDGGSDV